MFHILFVFVCLSLHISPIITVETTTAIDTQSLSVTTTEEPQPPPPPLPNSTAKLVRFRRQPPLTIVKHIIRSSKRSKPRRRIKRPKIRYGPPSYSYGEPITYYKPRLPSPPIKHPSYSPNDFEHLNLNSADFDLPSSSYETHSMDLDFYSNSGHSLYETSKTPKVEYSYDAKAPEEPSYSYSPPSSKPKPSYSYSSPSKSKVSAPLHIPHQTYGVPKEYDDSDGYAGSSNYYDSSETLSGGEPYHVPSDDTYELISSPFLPESHDQRSYSPPETVHKPSSQYGAPSSHIPDSYEPLPAGPPEYHPPASNTPESYSVYDKKIPNSGYSSGRQHNFAEPPSQNQDIEISYSPSYEINLSSSNHPHPGGDSDQASPDPHPGNFAEPPPQPHVPPSPSQPPPPPSYQAPDHSSPPAQTSHPHETYPYSPQEDYLPPPSQELPLNTNHMQPTYDFPKSSYEVPIYDPIPFEASNKNEEEFYPPHPQDHAAGPRQKPSQTESARDENSNSDYHSQPGVNESIKEPKEDAHPQGSSPSSTTRRQRRRRKRIRGSSTTTSASSSTKHILDVPELQEAFEAENNQRDHRDNRDSPSSIDTDVNESNHVTVEKQNYHSNYVTSSTEVPIFSSNENYISNAWNPMRIRTSSHHIISPPTITSHVADGDRSTSAATNRQRQRTHLRPQQRLPPSLSRSPQPTTENSAIATKNFSPSGKIEIVSIEKSRSSSYYDGTVAPPPNHSTTTNWHTSRPNRFNRFHTRPSRPALTHVATNKDTTTPKRTTKSVFDTTYFKSPRNHKDLEYKLSTLGQNLPKNHKLY